MCVRMLLGAARKRTDATLSFLCGRRNDVTKLLHLKLTKILGWAIYCRHPRQDARCHEKFGFDVRIFYPTDYIGRSGYRRWVQNLFVNLRLNFISKCYLQLRCRGYVRVCHFRFRWSFLFCFCPFKKMSHVLAISFMNKEWKLRVVDLLAERLYLVLIQKTCLHLAVMWWKLIDIF